MKTDDTVRWGATASHPILMIPGPTELPWPVLQAMNQPAIIQYDASFDLGVLEPATLALREIFQTPTGEVIVLPGSGRTSLEASALSVIEPGDRVLVVVAGVFGQLMRAIMDARRRRGHRVRRRVGPAHRPRPARAGDRARAPEGRDAGAQRDVDRHHLSGRRRGADRQAARARSSCSTPCPRSPGIDVRTDEWGVDFNMTGSQKCLAAPLGMALVSVSPAALGGDGAAQAQGLVARPTTCCAGRSSGSRCRAAGRSPTGRPAGSPCRSRPTSPARWRRPPGSSWTRACRTASAATPRRGRGLPGRARRHAPRDVPGHPSLLSNTVSCFKAPAGIDPAAVVRTCASATAS